MSFQNIVHLTLGALVALSLTPAVAEARPSMREQMGAYQPYDARAGSSGASRDAEGTVGSRWHTPEQVYNARVVGEAFGRQCEAQEQRQEFRQQLRESGFAAGEALATRLIAGNSRYYPSYRSRNYRSYGRNRYGNRCAQIAERTYQDLLTAGPSKGTTYSVVTNQDGVVSREERYMAVQTGTPAWVAGGSAPAPAAPPPAVFDTRNCITQNGVEYCQKVR